MKKLKAVGVSTAVVALVGAGVLWFASRATEQDIAAFSKRVVNLAATSPSPAIDRAGWSQLPAPIQRYFGFVFPEDAPANSVVALEAEGEFRRPLTESFSPTTAEQTIAIGEPALMFSATTSVLPGIWARAYDYFAQGEMEMKAKILSLVTVVDESETPTLNQISLRRWLLESALYPQALLPGGPVTWEAIDNSSARAVIEQGGLRATMVAHIDEAGRMTHMSAEQDGDLLTPYHGSGEHVSRSDYQRVGNQMIPMDFTISRAADGKIYPFWEGSITSITFR
ncbi:MAG: DUF6544 family protein [Burkholderiaceae bacterium]